MWQYDTKSHCTQTLAQKVPSLATIRDSCRRRGFKGLVQNCLFSDHKTELRSGFWYLLPSTCNCGPYLLLSLPHASARLDIFRCSRWFVKASKGWYRTACSRITKPNSDLASGTFCRLLATVVGISSYPCHTLRPDWTSKGWYCRGFHLGFALCRRARVPYLRGRSFSPVSVTASIDVLVTSGLQTVTSSPQCALQAHATLHARLRTRYCPRFLISDGDMHLSMACVPVLAHSGHCCHGYDGIMFRVEEECRLLGCYAV
jgi:hypothetical protein